MSQTVAHEDVLAFWFGPLDALGRADAAHARRWFMKDTAFDDEIRRRFGALHAQVASGTHDDWLATPRGRLAYIVVLDQLPRNMFRGTAPMFASDPLALVAAVEGLDRGVDRQVAHAERSFCYMPLMHAEDVATQDRCVSLFAAWRAEVASALQDSVASGLKYAEAHRDIIRRFGRFPHRNALLGRDSTPEERAFLEEPGSSF